MKTVIFDLDGTLIDSLIDIVESCNIALQRCNYPLRKMEEYPYFIGRGIRNLVKSAMPEYAQENEQELEVCLQQFREAYKQKCCDKTRPFDGMVETLNTLKKRGFKLAIFSNKTDDLTQLVVSKMFAPGTFDVIFGASDTLPRKPDPEGIYRICKILNIPKEEAIMVGDSQYDMETAHNAGIKAALARWQCQRREDLSHCLPDYILLQPSDLLVFV